MASMPAAPAVTVVTATVLETLAARRVLRGRLPVRRTGIGLAKGIGNAPGSLVSCGLAGALFTDLPVGTVVIPDDVGGVGGGRHRCDPGLVAALREAAHRLGATACAAPLLTAPHLVRGAERARWVAEGWGAVDMESAGLFDRDAPVAVVRVIVDGPTRELSADWVDSRFAALRPRRWPELVRLAVDAPRCADRAARVIAEALVDQPSSGWSLGRQEHRE